MSLTLSSCNCHCMLHLLRLLTLLAARLTPPQRRTTALGSRPRAPQAPHRCVQVEIQFLQITCSYAQVELAASRVDSSVPRTSSCR